LPLPGPAWCRGVPAASQASRPDAPSPPRAHARPDDHATHRPVVKSPLRAYSDR